MPELLTLTCPTCGAKLKVTDQIHLLLCRNCGNEHMVIRDHGTMYLAPLAQDVRQIRVGVDKTAAELAVVRLTKEVAELNEQLSSVHAQSLNNWGERSIMENAAWIFAAITGIFALSARGQDANGMAVAFGIICVALLALFFYKNAKRTHAAGDAKEAEIERITDTLWDKTASLAKNRAIAES